MNPIEAQIRSFLELPPPRNWNRTSPEVKRQLLGKSWWGMYIADVMAVFLLAGVPMLVSMGDTATMIGAAFFGGILCLPIHLLMRKIRKTATNAILLGRLYQAKVVGQTDTHFGPAPQGLELVTFSLEVLVEDATLPFFLTCPKEMAVGFQEAKGLQVLYTPGSPKHSRLLWEGTLLPVQQEEEPRL